MSLPTILTNENYTEYGTPFSNTNSTKFLKTSVQSEGQAPVVTYTIADVATDTKFYGVITFDVELVEGIKTKTKIKHYMAIAVSDDYKLFSIDG